MSAIQNRTVDIVVPFGPTTATRPGALAIVVQMLASIEVLGKLVVVANGTLPSSSEEELNFLRRQFRNLQTLHIPTANLSVARNLGAEAGSGDYVIFCDADTLAPPDTIESMMRLASPSTFVMGARRKYIPLTTDLDFLGALVTRNGWDTIDSIATEQPAQYSSDSYGSVTPPLIMRYALFGAFGIVHRALFEELGGFDPLYEGWGLEDIDFIRRLLRKSGCRLLSRKHVWHIDHYVEPYRAANHWLKNWTKYVSEIDKYGMLLVDEMLGNESWGRCDPRIWLKPKKHFVLRSRINSLSLTPKYHNALYNAVTNRMNDPDTCSVILYGSARYKRVPKDIDIMTLLFTTKIHDHRCNIQNSVLIEDKRMSLLDLSKRIGHPGRNPDAWLFVLSRLDSRWILGTRLDIGQYLDRLRKSAIERFAYHLITYHLGNLMLAIKKSRPVSGAAMHLACIVGIGCGTCPDLYNPPFFSDPNLGRTLREMIRLLKHGDKNSLQTVLSKYVKTFIRQYELSDGIGQVYYPASLEGWKTLVSWCINIGQPEWAKAKSYAD